MAENPRSVQGGSQAHEGRQSRADPESLEGSSRATIESAIKTAIEQALVAEVVGTPDAARSFSRIFNRDGDSFSRIFSRGTPKLKDLSVQDVTTMDDAAFAKFAERLKFLQEMGLSESSEGS